MSTANAKSLPEIASLSPAYDLTPNAGMNGEHATTVNGKGRSIAADDLVAVGSGAGLKESRARAIAEQVREVCAARGILAEGE